MTPSIPADMGSARAACTGGAVAVPAVVLAGGRATRMGGGDKPLLRLAGRTLLDRVLERLAPQAGPVAISANGDPARFGHWGRPVLPDPVQDRAGPLAGVLAAMRWARAEGERVLTVPGDVPFLPPDLVARLAGADAPIAVAASASRSHHLVALWAVALAETLAADLASGERRVGAWAAPHGAVAVAWPDADLDPFTNLNTPDDWAAAERALRRS